MKLALATFAGLLCCSCAAPPRDAGFGDVRRSVQERIEQGVVWDRGGPEDRVAREKVAGLLASPIGADEAVQIALLNNRGLQARYADLGVAQADVVRAGLLKNPVFDGDLKFSTDGGGTKVELAVVQDFLDVLMIPLRKRMAESEFAGAKLRVTAAALDLAGRTRVAFYDYQAAEQVVELRKTVTEAAGAAYDFAQRLRKAGNNTELALAQERATYEQSKLDLADAEAAALDARERLDALMGVWGEQVTWTAVGRLADPPAEELATGGVEKAAIERNLALAAARTRIESAAMTLGRRRSMGLFPEVGLGAAAERENEGGWSAGPALSLPIPLFDQGQSATAAARAELGRARDQYAATAVEVRAAARAARDRLAAARGRAAYLRQVILPLRHEITEQTQLQVNAMNAGPFELLQAKREEVLAGVAYIEALRAYWVARAEMGQILAGQVEEWPQRRKERNED